MKERKLNRIIPDSTEFKSGVSEILKVVQGIKGHRKAKKWVEEVLSEVVSANQQDPEKLLTTQEAADILQFSRSHLLRVINSGYLPFVQVGTHRRLKLKDVFSYKDSCERKEAGLLEIAQIGQELESDDKVDNNRSISD